MPENPTAKATPPKVEPAKTDSTVSDELLARAQEKAPRLTREFIDKHGLTKEQVEAYASGLDSPPPDPGPVENPGTDLHLTPGGWQATPKGVPPEDVGKNTIGGLR